MVSYDVVALGPAKGISGLGCEVYMRPKNEVQALPAAPNEPSKPELKEPSARKDVVAVTVKLPRDVYVRLKATAAAESETGQSLILQAIREYLDRRAHY